jgi:RNA polymerase subunit RPABC4/transcription elongation factor Spt4
METKTCENCDKVIGASESKCPSCGVVFEELEDAVATVDRANSILAKRKARTAPPEPTPVPEVPPAPAPEPTPNPQPKRNIFTSLGRTFRKQ